MIFVAAAFIILNLIVSGIIALDSSAIAKIVDAGYQTVASLNRGSITRDYSSFIAHIAFCILAYSGIESVIQTAGFVQSWREIHKAYLFLALTVGIVTPLVAILVLSAPIQFAQHEGDLITHYATMLNGVPFGVMVAILASITLIMAVNTAFVASSELIERVAHRYGFNWIIAINKRNSLYRIHLINACFFSIIILITNGSQKILADMYALGLLASFSINLFSLIIYRYSKGTKEVASYHTSRFGTLILCLIMASCFVFLAKDKPYGLMLWISVTVFVLISGIAIAKRRSPEIIQVSQAESEMEMVLYLAESIEMELHVYFQRPRESEIDYPKSNEVYITFFSPRQGIPKRLGKNHFRFPIRKIPLHQRIIAILRVVEHEFQGKSVKVHFGWPMSSWLDRMSITVMIYHIMKMPRLFPQMGFVIQYDKPWDGVSFGTDDRRIAGHTA